MIKGRFHIIHVFIRLLDDGQRNGTLAACHRNAFLLGRHNIHLAKVTQTDDTSFFAQKYIPHVLFGAQKGGKLDIVFIVTIAHGHAARFHIVLRQHSFYVFYGKPQYSQFIGVGNNL